MDELKSTVKPFVISKWEVKDDWEKVRANKGAPGVHFLLPETANDLAFLVPLA